MARELRSRNYLAFFLVFLIFLSPFSGIIFFENDLKLSKEIRNESISIGESKIIDVLGHPFPSSDEFTIEIPKNTKLDMAKIGCTKLRIL